MPDTLSPFEITLDLFCPEGLLILKARNTALFTAARNPTEKRQVVEQAIAELVHLAGLAKAELDKANRDNPVPAQVEAVYDQLVDIDLAIQGWRLSVQNLPPDKAPVATKKARARPRIDVDFDAMGPTLTKDQVMAISGYSESWVEKMTAKNRIPGIKRAVVGNRVVYDKAVIQQWFRDNFPLKPGQDWSP